MVVFATAAATSPAFGVEEIDSLGGTTRIGTAVTSHRLQPLLHQRPLPRWQTRQVRARPSPLRPVRRESDASLSAGARGTARTLVLRALSRHRGPQYWCPRSQWLHRKKSCRHSGQAQVTNRSASTAHRARRFVAARSVLRYQRAHHERVTAHRARRPERPPSGCWGASRLLGPSAKAVVVLHRRPTTFQSPPRTPPQKTFPSAVLDSGALQTISDGDRRMNN